MALPPRSSAQIDITAVAVGAAVTDVGALAANADSAYGSAAIVAEVSTAMAAGNLCRHAY